MKLVSDDVEIPDIDAVLGKPPRWDDKERVKAFVATILEGLKEGFIGSFSGSVSKYLDALTREGLNYKDWPKQRERAAVEAAKRGDLKGLVDMLRPLESGAVDPTPATLVTEFLTGGANSWSRVKAKLDAAAPISPWTLHDLRRTCVTGMANIGVAPHVVEACVNHISGAKASVAGVYNKAAYAPEKQSAFERWARYVALVVDPKLYVAHEKFLAADGTDEGRARTRKVFIDALHDGGQRWADYLTMITTDNVTPLPQRRRQ